MPRRRQGSPGGLEGGTGGPGGRPLLGPVATRSRPRHQKTDSALARSVSAVVRPPWPGPCPGGSPTALPCSTAGSQSCGQSLCGQAQRPLASGRQAEPLSSRTPPARPPTKLNVTALAETGATQEPLRQMLATKTAVPASGEGGHLPVLELRVLQPCHLLQLPALRQDSGARGPGCLVSAAAAGRGLEAAPGPDGRLAG